MKLSSYMVDLKQVLEQYDIGSLKQVYVLNSGLVHTTCVVETSTGEYIIQRLHEVLASDTVGEDVLAVTQHLEQEGIQAPKIILTKQGAIHAQVNGETWRMQTKLPGTTVDVIKDRSMAKQAGEIYARFHKAMDSLDYTFKSPLKLHETKKIYKQFQQIPLLFTLPAGRQEEGLGVVKDEFDLIEKELPNHFLPDNLPQRVIHGDPKISNILFEDETASAIIDLDTCNTHTVLVDLGDAFRSWCGNEEDDPNNKFCLRMAQSAWSGYKKGAGDLLTKQEIDLLPTAIGTIILELACRFLTDYFEDSYFGWDETRYESRKAHNLARARGQLALFRSYQEKLPKLKAIISK